MKKTLTKQQGEKLDRAFEEISKRVKETTKDKGFELYFSLTRINELEDVLLDVDSTNSETLEWYRADLIEIIKDEIERQGITYLGEEDNGSRDGIFWIYVQF